MASPAAFSGEVAFTVRRRQPELVAPSKPTPREMKLLSDIDDQEGLQLQMPVIHFYGHKASMKGKDPAQVIKKALSQALVFYYPFAGRLREGPARKLMVDCNGEGVMFIEADADITLQQFGDTLQPPFPCFDELLYNVPGSEGVINCPLLIFQVTCLKCGGFILAYRFNHTISDAAGIFQFLYATAEIARGASEPSVAPVWRRELLSARNPPRITCTHREYEEVPINCDDQICTQERTVEQSFFFGPKKLEAIRQLFEAQQQYTTRFEALTAFLWRCRTKALQLQPSEEVRFMCVNNLRNKSKPPLLPVGYYGNAFVLPAAVTTAGKLCENPLGYALEMVKKAKAEATMEYIQSVADLMVIKGRPCFNSMPGTWIASDISRLRFRDVDFGWGKAVYGGPAKAAGGPFTGVSLYVACENAKGEEGVVVPFYLPLNAMKRFNDELDHDHVLGKL